MLEIDGKRDTYIHKKYIRTFLSVLERNSLTKKITASIIDLYINLVRKKTKL